MSDKLATIKQIPKQVGEFLPKVTAASEKITAAIKAYKPIKTDGEEEGSLSLAKRIRATSDKTIVERKAITSLLDDVKKVLMDPEKAMKEAEDVIRQDLSRYATIKADAAKKKQDKIDTEVAKKKHLSDIESEMKLAVTESIINMVASGKVKMYDFLGGLTLENFDEKVKVVASYKIALKKEAYEELFKVPYDANILTLTDYKKVVGEVKKLLPYKEVNENYVKQAEEVRTEIVEKLPSFRENLEKEGSIDAEALVEEAEKDKQRQIEEAKEQSEEEKKFADVEADFEGQLKSQEIDQPKNTRKSRHAEIIAKGAKIPKVIQTVMLNCMMHPDFPGIVARDAQKFPKKDDKGRQEYIPAVEWWLNWFSNHCEAEIDGLEITEDVKAIVR